MTKNKKEYERLGKELQNLLLKLEESRTSGRTLEENDAIAFKMYLKLDRRKKLKQKIKLEEDD